MNTERTELVKFIPTESMPGFTKAKDVLMHYGSKAGYYVSELIDKIVDSIFKE